MTDDAHIKRSKPSIARLKKAARLAQINSKNWVTLASSKRWRRHMTKWIPMEPQPERVTTLPVVLLSQTIPPIEENGFVYCNEKSEQIIPPHAVGDLIAEGKVTGIEAKRAWDATDIITEEQPNTWGWLITMEEAKNE